MTEVQEPGGHLHLLDNVSVPRWVFADFLDNQPGWPDLARRYINAPAIAAAPPLEGLGGQDSGPLQPEDRASVPTEGHDAAVLAVNWWLGELEGWSVRMERLVEDLESGADIIPWLVAAYELGVTAPDTALPTAQADAGGGHD